MAFNHPVPDHSDSLRGSARPSLRQRRPVEVAIGISSGTAGVIALVGAVYGLFGPLVTEDGQTTSYYARGLSAWSWALFVGYGAGAIGVAAAGGLLARGTLRPAATLLLVVSTVGLGVLAGFTVLGVGWLVLPGACLAWLALLLRLFVDRDR